MSKVDDAIAILKALGLPQAQQNERSALTLLALADLREDDPWSASGNRPIGIHDILVFISTHYGKQYAENTRETIRRQTIHQFEQAGVVVRNPDDPQRPTNSPKTVYALTGEALTAVNAYRSSLWENAVEDFIRRKGKLIDKYDKRRQQNLIEVSLSEAVELYFSQESITNFRHILLRNSGRGSAPMRKWCISVTRRESCCIRKMIS